MEFLFWAAAVLLLYIFFGYPASLSLLARFVSVPVRKQDITPPVTLVVPAHNEEKVIASKIRNSLELDYPRDRLEIICASDGSTDRTVAIARELLPAENVLDLPQRQGKTSIINAASALARGDIVVYTDANILLDRSALRCLVRNFADPAVGCVAGQLTHVNADESLTAASVGLYWRYEELIKRKESETGAIVGADGGLFGIRRELFRPLPLTIIDDFGTSMGILTQGYRVVFEPAARAFERASTTTREELRRKVRIATRSVSASVYLAPGIRRLPPLTLWKFVSHRVLRYASVYLMLGALLANGVLVATGAEAIYTGLLAMQAGFYGMGIVGIPLLDRKPSAPGKLLRLVSYFILANAAACYGATRGLLGSRLSLWESPKSAR